MDIRKTRKAACLTQEQAASMIGVCRRTWWNWEAGRTRMPKAARELFKSKTSAPK